MSSDSRIVGFVQEVGKQLIILELGLFVDLSVCMLDIWSSYLLKKSIKEFEVLSGPYSSVNPLKNDYIKLKGFGFEELDILINE